MNCRWVSRNLTAYVEGELTFVSTWLMREHLTGCEACFRLCEGEDNLVRQVRRLQAIAVPLNLRIKLLVALSHANESSWSLWKVQFRNAMRPIAVPATGGVFAAVILFLGLGTNFYFVPPTLDADVPLTYLTRSLVSDPIVSTAPSFAVAHEIAVEAFVDGQGHVYDFRIIRLPGSFPEPDRMLRAQLAHALLSARFDPATHFGRPTLGRVLLSFRPTTQVHVQG